MTHAIIFLLLTVLLLSLAGCRSDFVEPEAMKEFLDGVVENIGDSQITDDDDLIGARLLVDDDSYVGEYTAECSHMTGRDVVFGGASIHNRALFLSGHIDAESGKATVRIRMNSEVIELEPDADGYFETTLKLDNGGNYIMMIYEDFSGMLKMTCEYMDEE